MRLSILTALAAAAVLAACSPAAEAPQPPEAEAPAAAPPMLAGVDLTQPLRALGTEPFWAVELTGSELVYSGVDRPEQRAANPGPVIQGTTAVYATATGAGTTLVVTLMDTDCSDGMSDRTYPFTATLEVLAEQREGCAWTERRGFTPLDGAN